VFLPCFYRVLPCFSENYLFSSKPVKAMMTGHRKTVSRDFAVFLPCVAMSF